MKLEISVEGRRGPFHLRKLKMPELVRLTELMQEADMTKQCLFLAFTCVVDGKGKQVFKDEADAEARLGAVDVMEAGIMAFRFNRVGRLAKLGTLVEDALKN